MTKAALFILLIFSSAICYSQTIDGLKIKKEPFSTYDELRKKQSDAQIGTLTYLDSTYNYQVEVPNWLQLREVPHKHDFGGTLPAVNGIENAILIKTFNKNEFKSFSSFKKWIVEDLVFGQPAKWSTSYIFMGKKQLEDYASIGNSYKVYLTRNKLMYHCEYLLVETKSAYLWIDYTATPETFDINYAKFKEFIDGFKITDL